MMCKSEDMYGELINKKQTKEKTKFNVVKEIHRNRKIMLN